MNIEKIKAAALAATQTPWEFWQGYVAADIDIDGGVIICERPRPSGGKFQKAVDNNFKHIAAANPSAVLELIEMLESAEANQVLSASARQYKQMEERLEAAERDAAKYKWLCNMHTKSHTDWFVYAATGPDLDVEVTEAMKEKP